MDYGFQGRRLDPESGLLYFRHRYYDPELGRFVQRDPVWDAGNVGGWYSFVGSSPLSFGDPSGTLTELQVIDQNIKMFRGLASQYQTWTSADKRSGAGGRYAQWLGEMDDYWAIARYQLVSNPAAALGVLPAGQFQRTTTVQCHEALSHADLENLGNVLNPIATAGLILAFTIAAPELAWGVGVFFLSQSLTSWGTPQMGMLGASLMLGGRSPYATLETTTVASGTILARGSSLGGGYILKASLNQAETLALETEVQAVANRLGVVDDLWNSGVIPDNIISPPLQPIVRGGQIGHAMAHDGIAVDQAIHATGLELAGGAGAPNKIAAAWEQLTTSERIAVTLVHEHHELKFLEAGVQQGAAHGEALKAGASGFEQALTAGEKNFLELRVQFTW